MPIALRTQHLTVRYPHTARPALRHLSLTIHEGKTVVLLGPSGGGKSTLALTLTGLIPHDIFAHIQGRITVDGLDPTQAAPGAVAARVGLLLQDPEASFATLTVEDELAFGLENLRVPPEAMAARIQTALEQVGLPDYRTRRLDTLSGGEMQRIALAALLAMRPPILILDEPTANLDPRATREFFETLAHLKGTHTILLIEHKLSACLPLADRVILLDEQGGLLAQGEPLPTLKAHLDQVLRAGIWVPLSLDPRTRSAPPKTFPPLVEHPPAVAVHGLTFAYPDGPPVLRAIDLTIPQGDFVALLGPNGAGKSTLALLLMGLLPQRPSQGEIWLFGERLEDLTPARLTERMGYVFQNPEHQFVTDRVWDELAYGPRVRRWPEARIRQVVDDLLQRFRLSEQADRNPFTLSQGQKRRLSVGTMLAVGQRLLILDEPTFGQDRNTAYALMDLLRDLNRQGVTILMITHDLRFVREYARRTVVLHQGHIAFDGLTEDLFAAPALLAEAHLS